MTLIRQLYAELEKDRIDSEMESVKTMRDYFSRQDTHDQVRGGVKTRYGIGIKKVENPANSTKPLETYVKEGFHAQVDAGITQTITIGFGQKIVNAHATLFTESAQRWTLTSETTADLEDAEAYLHEQRQKGRFRSVLVSTDESSVQVGSAGLLVHVANEHLTYQEITRDNIRFRFGEMVIDNNVPRMVDRKDIEDASFIIIRLGQVDVHRYQYLAIYGKSDEYPEGRWVQYVSGSDFGEIPSPNDRDSDAIDYEIDGTPCNPLTYFANRNPDVDVPEYPIVILTGGITKSDEIMPVTTSLYDDCIELDIAASHTLGTSQDSARGTLALERTATGGGTVPRTLTGAVDVPYGMTIKHVSHGAGESDTALDTLRKLMVDMAAGYSVPDYMIISEDHALEASSGIALEVKTRPLQGARDKRIEDNADAVNRLFQIEKSLLMQFSEDPLASVLFGCEQLWDPGQIVLPENKLERVKRLQIMFDKGWLDTIDVIREYNNLSSDDEAIELYEKKKERAQEYPPLTTTKKSVGLPRRNALPPAADDEQAV